MNNACHDLPRLATSGGKLRGPFHKGLRGICHACHVFLINKNIYTYHTIYRESFRKNGGKRGKRGKQMDTSYDQ